MAEWSYPIPHAGGATAKVRVQASSHRLGCLGIQGAIDVHMSVHACMHTWVPCRHVREAHLVIKEGGGISSVSVMS